MTFDMTKKRAADSGTVELKNADLTPMLDDDGNAMSVTLHSPGSKPWRAAEAEMNRKRAERLQKSGGRMAAAMDNAIADQVEFLASVTISFNGWHYPVEKGSVDPKAMFRAAYSDDALGYIRDQVAEASNDWAVFTKG